MKIIIAGSTGFIGTELVRQALAHPAFTSVVALARRETPTPAGVDGSKLKSVALPDFSHYPDSVKEALADADACIWTIAVTPSKLKTVTPEQASVISRDHAVTGIQTIAKLRQMEGKDRPLRFLYVSGSNAVRDPADKPYVMGDYAIMRGDAEVRIVDYAKEFDGTVETAVAKPGLVTTPDRFGALMTAVTTVGRFFIGLPKIELRELSAAMLDQVINGFEKEPLLNEDLERIGQRVLAAQEKNASTS